MMKDNAAKWLKPVFFSAILLSALFLSLNMHSRSGYFNWKSEIWCDRAGYYIFLPATLYYHWDFKQVPEKMDEKTGYGFYYEQETQKIRTKYTYGVSLLLSPFFVGVHYITKIFGIPQDWAFAPIYHKMTDVAASVYLVLGLIFLFGFLRKYFNEAVCYLTTFFIFAGTNLFYYVVSDPMMSHVYSFFLVSVFLFSLKEFLDGPRKLLYFLVVSVSLSLAILIRPVNIILFFVLLLLDVNSPADIKARLKLLLRPRYILIFIVIYILVWIPQMAYNHYLTGSWFAYTHDKDGFSNLASPRIPELWFSTLNGLFTYTPMMFLVIAGMLMMILKKQANGWLILGLFVLLSYVFSSWWCWYFGCSFGQRSFVEYLPLFALPFAYILRSAWESPAKYKRVLVVLLILGFTYFNIRLTYAYENCFFGSAWDWNHYSKQLKRAKLYPFDPGYAFKNDFENDAINAGNTVTRKVSRSGDCSGLLDAGQEYSANFFEYPGNMKNGALPEKVSMKIWVFKTGTSPTGGQIVCDVRKDGKTLFWEARPVDVPMAAGRIWYMVPANFDLPDTLDPWSELRIYVWNKNKTTFYVDDMSVSAQ